MRQELPHCPCYCAMTMLPLPCWLALLPLVDCCFSKKIIPHTITGWTARIAAMDGAIMPGWRHCHHCANTMLTCLLVLSPLVDCCFTIFLKYSDTICWQHGTSSCNAAAIVPQHCCHFALLALVLVLFPLVDYFFLHNHKSWVASCAASCCNAAATDAALLLHITACCMATLVANTNVTATMTLFSPTNHQADAFCLVSWLLGLSLGAAAA